jgi:hypothetical protein
VLLVHLLMPLLLLASLFYFWYPCIACLRSAVNVCDFPVVSAAVALCSLCEFLLLLLVSLLNVAVFSTVYSGGPTADGIHDDAVVPAAAVISDFNCIPALAVIHTVLAVPLSLSFLLLLAFLLL